MQQKQTNERKAQQEKLRSKIKRDYHQLAAATQDIPHTQEVQKVDNADLNLTVVRNEGTVDLEFLDLKNTPLYQEYVAKNQNASAPFELSKKFIKAEDLDNTRILLTRRH